MCEVFYRKAALCIGMDVLHCIQGFAHDLIWIVAVYVIRYRGALFWLETV